MKITKNLLQTKVNELVKVARENNKGTIRFNEINKIFAKNLEGRYFIHSKATKEQLTNLYVDTASYVTNLIEMGTL